jgi:hypothetical protein
MTVGKVSRARLAGKIDCSMLQDRPHAIPGILTLYRYYLSIYARGLTCDRSGMDGIRPNLQYRKAGMNSRLGLPVAVNPMGIITPPSKHSDNLITAPCSVIR